AVTIFNVVNLNCAFQIVVASLLGVLLAPALANRNDTENFKKHHGENSLRYVMDTGVCVDSEEGLEGWKSAWDVKTGYVATKVFSKHACIVAKMDRRFLHDRRFPAAPQGHKGPGSRQYLPRENRFIISRNRLQSLRRYGKRIQTLCRGIPAYLAYPTVGSNLSKQNVSCLKVKINKLPIYYCDYLFLMKF
ncbi:gastrokine-1-like, partial [Columba livia]